MCRIIRSYVFLGMFCAKAEYFLAFFGVKRTSLDRSGRNQWSSLRAFPLR